MAVSTQSPLVEPFLPLNGDDPSGNPARDASPDPLVRYTWSPARTNLSALQRYEVATPVAWVATPPSAFQGLDSLATGKPNVTVIGAGQLRIDFGVERAAWLEFESLDLPVEQLSGVTASISEYNEPWPGKTRVPKAYSGGAYRLETNPELYEGVRYAWLTSNTSTPWTLTGLRLVAQSKPANYTGSFDASDPLLARAWYTGAYGSRLNMMPYGFNSILMDRGDRVAIQGDGHPTMAAALAAFGGPTTFELVHRMLVATDSGCANASQCPVIDSGIMPYPLYWASTVHDWYWASGDVHRFRRLVPDVGRILDNAVDKFLQPHLNVAWFGWDDRVGNGFCGTCNTEAQLGFAALTIRACNDFAASLRHAGDVANASKYNATAHRLAGMLRARNATSTPGKSAPSVWHADYGVHAAAYLVNARIVATDEEAAAIFKRELTNAVTICSFSPFNQYWILQALGSLGHMEHAIASIKLCWGPMLQLGSGCFWELSSPEWMRFMNEGDKAPTRPSYCHPWASGVTHWLSHHLAGVTPISPGFGAGFVATPHVSWALLPRVAATVPTPQGPVAVTAERDTVSVRVTVEARVPGVVGLRLVDEATGCALDLATAKLDGRSVDLVAGRFPDTDFLSPVQRELSAGTMLSPARAAQHAFVAVSKGAHTVTASYAAHCVDDTQSRRVTSGTRGAQAAPSMMMIEHGQFPNAPPFLPATYPGSWTMDNRTGGSWRGKYGKEGFQLVAFGADGANVTQLPPWVRSISLFKGKAAHVGSDPGNTSFLQAPSTFNGDDVAGPARQLGFVTAGADGSQGTVVDVNVTAGTPYLLSLYMVSSVKPQGASTWSFTRQAIRVMDLESLNPVAPTPLIADAPGGVYWTLRYDRGVRLRVMPIDSDAGWSAIFFDKAVVEVARDEEGKRQEGNVLRAHPQV